MNPSDSFRVVRSDEGNAIQTLQTKIASAEKLQAMMKAANVIVRNQRMSESAKVAQLSTDCGLSEVQARALLKPDYGGRIGFPDYKLTNNGANIRRMQQRVKGLADEGARVSVTLPFVGGRVEDHAEDCRVRIYHEARPPGETIAQLRRYGFHWTPSLNCWQRLRNDSARYAAGQITGVRWPEVQPANAGGPSVATVNAMSSAPAPKSGIAA